jgi:hypothetical protein
MSGSVGAVGALSMGGKYISGFLSGGTGKKSPLSCKIFPITIIIIAAVAAVHQISNCIDTIEEKDKKISDLIAKLHEKEEEE